MRRRRTADALASASASVMLVAGFLVTLEGCGGDREPSPKSVVVDLLELARIPDPPEDRLRATFADVPAPGAARAALLDALAGLAGATDPEIHALESAGAHDAFVDVTVRLPGGGSAAVNLRLEAGGDGSWRVRWFQGPGGEWPAGPRGRGEGLTSSAPPDTEH